VTRRADRDWERFARTEPYWAVLTDGRFRGESLSESAREAFYATGERHVDHVFTALAAINGASGAPDRALDFGCGVGRLLPGLARRCRSVVGADVSPRMVELARDTCRRMELHNAQVVRIDDRLSGLDGEFDFIHSVIVFQHIAPVRGEGIVERLCARLTPGGVGALHFTTAAHERRSALVLAAARDAFRPLHMALNLMRGRPAGQPLMRMHVYSLPRLCAIVERQGCSLLDVSPLPDAAYEGALLWIRRDADTLPIGCPGGTP